MRPVLKDISMSELETLRNEEKLTNREIASRLGVSYQTILKILGPQPAWLKKPRHFYGRVSKSRSPVSTYRDEPVKEAALISIDRPLVMAGNCGSYTVYPSGKVFDIEINNQFIRGIKLDQLNTIILELTRISENYKKLDRGDLMTW